MIKEMIGSIIQFLKLYQYRHKGRNGDEMWEDLTQSN